mmetsp:Transcript_6109/g.15665  ORF Transcript_6109/g.15665 Transcript_6109/m.15665 type:complete len:383 (-) Transcript_6109:69-1217(-)|eukprot:CAMPEP_0195090300 /NCGR_PEP_ID=MMETSP0448-20130528/29329_1 /TAXON_ID=66468 /ORGANISM="Heterocapsa triquestra, Strain CCMP 448" /LENGTH=382 /DNA_ID=CAMNT_0040124109 /DNA_START=70 /DNA_END=1218 /DNA_ORIENTATION=+
MEPIAGEQGNRRGVSMGSLPALSFDIKGSDLEGAVDWLRTGSAAFGGEFAGKLLPAPPAPALERAPLLQRGVLPGEHQIRCAAEPLAVQEELKRFFRCESAMDEVGRWTLRGTVFVEFAALAFEANTYCDAANSATATILFKDLARRDTVRFSKLVAAAADFLTRCGLKVTSDLSVRGPCAEFEFDDELDLDEGRDWDLSVSEVLRTAGSASPSEREESLQLLARWGQQHPACRAALARGLMERKLFVAHVLASDVLSEAYPMAAATKYASLCQGETVKAFSRSLCAQLRSHRSALPLVQSELSQALEILQRTCVLTGGDAPCSDPESIEDAAYTITRYPTDSMGFSDDELVTTAPRTAASQEDKSSSGSAKKGSCDGLPWE